MNSKQQGHIVRRTSDHPVHPVTWAVERDIGGGGSPSRWTTVLKLKVQYKDKRTVLTSIPIAGNRTAFPKQPLGTIFQKL